MTGCDSLSVVRGSGHCRNRLAAFSRSDGTDVVLVSGLMTFALLSLAFAYVEARYVRYGGLSYLLGTPVLAAVAGDLTVHQFRSIKAAIGIKGVFATVLHFTGASSFSTMTGCRCKT